MRKVYKLTFGNMSREVICEPHEIQDYKEEFADINLAKPEEVHVQEVTQEEK